MTFDQEHKAKKDLYAELIADRDFAIENDMDTMDIDRELQYLDDWFNPEH